MIYSQHGYTAELQIHPPTSTTTHVLKMWISYLRILQLRIRDYNIHVIFSQHLIWQNDETIHPTMSITAQVLKSSIPG